MAMSKLKEDPMDNILQCGYCSQIFQKPKILPCLHTFCEQCIGSAIKANGRQDDDEFSCPLCRTKVKPWKDDAGIETWAANLKDNLTISAMLASRTGKEYNCGVCDQNGRKLAARFWCDICQDAFCENCHSFHKSLKILSNHKTVPINEKINAKSGFDLSALTSRCVNHSDRKIEVFCSNHKTPCCIMCLAENHRTCTDIGPIENVKTTMFDDFIDLSSDLKKGIQNLLTSKQEHKTRVNEALKLAEDDASKFQEVLKCQIDTMFEAYIKKLETFKDEENTKLNVQLRLLEQYDQNLKHWTTACTFVKEHGTDQTLLQYMETIKRQILVRSEELKNSFETKTGSTVNIGFVKDGFLEKIVRAKEIGSLKVENGNVVGLQEQIDSISRSASSIVGVENATKVKSDRMIEEYILEKCCDDVEGEEYIEFDEEEDDIQYKYDEKSFKSESKYCNTKKGKSNRGDFFENTAKSNEAPMLYKSKDVYSKYGGVKYSDEVMDKCKETKQSATKVVPHVKEVASHKQSSTDKEAPMLYTSKGVYRKYGGVKYSNEVMDKCEETKQSSADKDMSHVEEVASHGIEKKFDQRECRKKKLKYEYNEKETYNTKSLYDDDKVSEPQLKNKIGYKMANIDDDSKPENREENTQHDRNDIGSYGKYDCHGSKKNHKSGTKKITWTQKQHTT